MSQARQYRERGLIHIEDDVYIFFMALESERVQQLNNEAMRKEKANMAEVAYQQLMENKELKLKWRECFRRDDVTTKEVKAMYI